MRRGLWRRLWRRRLWRLTMSTIEYTWGIAGAQVLWGYGALCAFGAIGVWRERRRVLGPAATNRDPQPELGPYRLALLSGGPDRAITAAAVQLFGDGRLKGDGATLTASGELPVTADPLERAVFETVRREPGVTVELMNARVRDSGAMTALTEQMTRSGLLLDAAQARRLRLLWVVPAALAAIGLALVLTGADDSGAPIEVLFGLVAAAVFATLRLVGIRSLATHRGGRLLERRRRESASRRTRPAAGEIGLMTALYGGGALWLSDPITAAALRVPREQEPNGGGGSGGCGVGGGGDWGGDGGGGCGGGGCGGAGN